MGVGMRSDGHARRTSPALAVVLTSLLAIGLVRPHGTAAQPEREAPLDLAAMTLTFADLEDEGFDGFVSGGVVRHDLEVFAEAVADYTGADLDEVEEILFEDAGMQQAYERYQVLPDKDEPETLSTSTVRSYVYEYAEPDGVPAVWELIEDESGVDGEDLELEDLEDVPEIGDESEATLEQGEDPTTGPYQSIDVSFRYENLTAGVTLYRWDGEDVDLDEVVALAERLLERIEAVLDGEAPGLSTRVVRLAGEPLVYADGYEYLDGEAMNRFLDQTEDDWDLAAEAFEDRGVLAAYDYLIFYGEETDAPGYRAYLELFEDEDAASAFVTDFVEAREDDAFAELEIDDEADELGDESLAVAVEFGDDAGFAYVMVVRVEETVVSVWVYGPEPPDADLAAELAEEAAACLADGDCLEPIPAPEELAEPDLSGE